MDFDFIFKLIITCCFLGVTICLCIKWLVEAYLDYMQVVTGIKVVTLSEMKRQMERGKDIDNDPTSY
jgi:hypothetical protein